MYLLPPEYTETMKVLQDNCPATPLSDIKQLVQHDIGLESLDDIFEDFNPNPIGVASLAQVFSIYI